jgi:hypothetical protein
MRPSEIVEELAQLNPDALLLMPREVYDKCLVGFTDQPNDHWPRKERVFVAVYDAQTCIEEFADAENVDLQTSVEWFEFNTSGAWVGENTPTFRYGAEE